MQNCGNKSLKTLTREVCWVLWSSHLLLACTTLCSVLLSLSLNDLTDYNIIRPAAFPSNYIPNLITILQSFMQYKDIAFQKCLLWSPFVLLSFIRGLLVQDDWFNDPSQLLSNVYSKWTGCFQSTNTHPLCCSIVIRSKSDGVCSCCGISLWYTLFHTIYI